MSGPPRHWEQDKDSTIYIGNLAEEVTDALVWELMIQCGPVVNVHLPKDRVSQTHQGYGFVEFRGEQDADYAIKIMNNIRMFGKPIRLNKASADKRGGDPGTTNSVGIGAEIFVGNLDSMVDERSLYETFSRFGPLLAPPKITRDDNNLSKGYGFVSYASFEASDAAIANMHGQYLMNKEVTVQYAYKKDGRGDRHGDAAERELATQARKNGVEISIPAMPAALVMPPQAATAPVMPAANGYGQGPGMQMPYGYAPPPQYQHQARQYNQTPLQAPGLEAGLPARPSTSNAGYGGPPVMPQGYAPPPGVQGVMPGMPMPGYPAPPSMPPGYQGRPGQ